VVWVMPRDTTESTTGMPARWVGVGVGSGWPWRTAVDFARLTCCPEAVLNVVSAVANEARAVCERSPR
jgi:hypothetical protein